MTSAPVTEDHLARSLEMYAGYLPTASEHLRISREKWIPVVIDCPEERAAVRRTAWAILNGAEYSAEYAALSAKCQLGTALCLMVAWSEHLWFGGEAPEEGATPSSGSGISMQDAHEYTRRVFEFLAGICIDWQALAVRNWSSTRDGGRVPALQMIAALSLTRVDVLMQVYVGIRIHWDKIGSDWGRRGREEAALAKKRA